MTGTPEERKLEWACKQIEALLKRVSDLETPRFVNISEYADMDVPAGMEIGRYP